MELDQGEGVRRGGWIVSLLVLGCKKTAGIAPGRLMDELVATGVSPLLSR